MCKKRRRPSKQWKRKRKADRARADQWAYAIRNQLLASLGWSSYASYLLSDTWTQIRSRVLVARPACACCGRPAITVHHLVYTKSCLLGKLDGDLVSLCGACHHAIEFKADGSKATPKGANIMLRRLTKINRLLAAFPLLSFFPVVSFD